MMKTIYLRNGEEALLHKEIDGNNFIIERMMMYYDYEGNEEIEPNGVQELVSEIFIKPPISKKQDEFITLFEKIETKSKELVAIEKQLLDAKNEIRNTERYKTDLDKHIINNNEVRNADKITVFSGYKPYTLSEKEQKNLKISFTIEVCNGKMSGWAYEIYDSESYSHSNHINPKYGLIINATDEEILRIGKEIVAETKDIKDYSLIHISDEYLTEELLAKKLAFKKADNKKKISNLEEDIKTKQLKLRELKTK